MVVLVAEVTVLTTEEEVEAEVTVIVVVFVVVLVVEIVGDATSNCATALRGTPQ